jgi:hypothetical protein
LLITGIKHVFFLIGATMTPGAILMESRTRDVELERVCSDRVARECQSTPSSKQQSGFQVRKSVSVPGRACAGQECRSLLPGVRAT